MFTIDYNKLATAEQKFMTPTASVRQFDSGLSADAINKFSEANRYRAALVSFSVPSKAGNIFPSLTAINTAEAIIGVAIATNKPITLLGPTSDEGIFMSISNGAKTLSFDINGGGEVFFADMSAAEPIAQEIDKPTAVQFIQSL